MGKAIKRDIGKLCFGGSLYQQGRGFYAALELFAILRGVFDLAVAESREPELLPTPKDGEPLRYIRRSHDFARRMPLAPEDLLDAEDLKALDGVNTRDTLAALVEALSLAPPGGRTKQVFKNRLLVPYVGELIHYDAVDSQRRRATTSAQLEGGAWITLERYTFRGAGGLAHKFLRTDHDETRLAENRAGLLNLVLDSGSALGRLAKALQAHDRIQPTAGDRFEDDGESEAFAVTGGEHWVENLRSGVRNIVSRSELPRPKRVRLLMYWVPYCLARYQLDVAHNWLGQGPPSIPVDLRSGANTIRAASQTLLNRCPVAIGDALEAARRSDEGEVAGQGQEVLFEKNGPRVGTGAIPNDTRAFFTTTLSAVGGLNASSGLRHFTLKLPLLEALIAAGLPPKQEMPFGAFCEEVLFHRFRLVVDGASARQTHLAEAIDTAEFDENAEVLARDLSSLGLLTEYSDDTRLVHAEAGA